jgi:FtsP/CotA-like multicopper oxidase with cupredoxin domain
MILCAAQLVFALPPNTTFLPTFSKELLTPVSQAATAWTNIAPNALASYYTYVPYTTADATAAGFPTTLNCGVAGALGSDCYTISIQQGTQAMALPGIFGGGAGLLGADGLTSTGILPTTFWGYGSGGLAWIPPGGLGTAVTGNAPTPFATAPPAGFGTTGIWHFPAPSIKGTSGRPVHIRWANTLPNNRQQGHDPALDCGTAAPYCYPYNRIVTHVHGAHVTPESDGLAIAWYSPIVSPFAAIYGEGKFPDAAYGTFGALVKQTPAQIQTQGPIYSYPMTQEAGTIWYHDHAMGLTHLNTNMGMAGFFPITDANEKSLQTAVAPALPVLPTGTGSKYELGFALQDRNFDVTGQMLMPDFASYDKNDPNCVFDANNNAIPGTCARLQWMKKLNSVASAADPTPAVHFVPYNATAPEVTNPADNSYLLNNPVGCKKNLNNPFEGVSGTDPSTGLPLTFVQCAPFPATSTTLEYFGNMPVVNGVTYPVYDVEPTVYRMRFIGGTDSRTWIMQLVDSTDIGVKVDCSTTVAAGGGCMTYTNTMPFWQIGSEQGLLINPVSRPDLDLMPGERLDVLVDFTGKAGKTISIKNLGDDTPYSGRYDFDTMATRQPTSVDIPELMRFRVAAAIAAPGTASAQTPSAATQLRGAGVTTYTALTPTNTRVVSLMEITDQYGRTMPTVDARGYNPIGMPVTEIIKLNGIEQWDIVNTTVDAHPMHLHQVAFQTINRQPLAMGVDALGFQVVAGFSPPVADLPNQEFMPPTYTVDPASIAITPPLWEAGWKDTITAPPGYVTRIKAKFDLVGDYVWHCHILSHEEHDMMRPFTVTDALNTAPTPFSITIPSTSDSGSFEVSWVGTAISGVMYELQEATAPTGPWTTITAVGGIISPYFNVTGKLPGTVWYYQVHAIPPVASGFVTSAFRTGATGCSVIARTAIATPLAGAVTIGAATPITIATPTAIPLTTVTKVDYYSDGTLLGSGTVAPSYSFSWLPTATDSGTHNLRAITYYSNNATSTSALRTVTVTAAVPAITLNTPVNPTTTYLGATIKMSATPSGLVGNPAAVEFYDGAVLVGTAYSAPYSISFFPTLMGVHNLTAKMLYGNGLTVTSAIAAVTVGYDITVIQSKGGVIAPPGVSVVLPEQSPTNAGVVAVASGGTQAFTITPNAGYSLLSVLVDGVAVVPAVSPYTFTNVLKTYEITATFAPLTPGAPVATAATLKTSTGFTANWGAALNAASYSLDVSTSATFATFVPGYNNLNVGNFVLPAVPSFAVTGLTPGTYYYRVRANNGTAITASSNVITVVVIPATKIGVFHDYGVWNLDKNGNGIWNPGIDSLFSFGITGDVPVSGDWNATGTSKIGVFRNGNWYLNVSATGAWTPPTDVTYTFGVAGDIPVTGVWSGVGKTNIGVFRNGTWYLNVSGTGAWNPAPGGTDVTYTFGVAGDIPVTGDWNGTGKTNIGVFRNGTWFLNVSGTGAWNPAPGGTDVTYPSFGRAGDIPVTGDWNGDGKTKIGVVRNGVWYLDMNGNGVWDQAVDATYNFGITSTQPITGKW